MIKHGLAPFLECSTKGDIRFSPFNARIRKRDGLSIESIYHFNKRFSDGSTGLYWKDAKQKILDGFTITNYDEVSKLYSTLWDEFFTENPTLLNVIAEATGISDIFGQSSRCCQANEIWRIRNSYLKWRDSRS